jgi:hypothetical protein
VKRNPKSDNKYQRQEVATEERFGMASSVNGPGNNTDEIRYKSYLTQLEREQDAQIKDKEDTHREHLSNIITTHEDDTKLLRKDYDVKISDEAEALDRKLSMIRERNQIISNQERENGEREADKVHNQYASKIETEKKTGDEQIARLQGYYKKASDELHHQYEKDRAKAALERGKA